MLGAFNTVYTALKSLLSSDFWTSVFAPLAMFAAIHAAIATEFGLHIDLAALTDDTSKFAKSLVLVVLGLVLVGYLLQGLMPLCRGLLDGSLLPAAVQKQLLSRRRPALAVEQAELTALFNKRAAARTFAEQLQDQAGAYRRAYRTATMLGTATNEPATLNAEASVALLGSLISHNVLPTSEQLVGARAAVLAAMAVNDPSLPAGTPGAALSLRTDQASDQLLDRADDAVRQASSDYESQTVRLRVATALRQPQATSLGDARFVAESYTQDTYAVAFDFLWPRLVLALRADAGSDPCNGAIEQGRARCDFAILAVILTGSVPLFWLPYMVLRGGPGWLFLVIGSSAPVLLSFFYRLAFEAQLAFAEIIKTTVDRHRFLVLKMLRQPTPTSRDDERQLWARIRNAEENSSLAYLPYAPPPAS